jgi:hypothetical protein
MCKGCFCTWGTMAICLLRLSNWTESTALPPTVIWPEVGSKNRYSRRMMVDLPDPEPKQNKNFTARKTVRVKERYASCLSEPMYQSRSEWSAAEVNFFFFYYLLDPILIWFSINTRVPTLTASTKCLTTFHNGTLLPISAKRYTGKPVGTLMTSWNSQSKENSIRGTN